MEIKRNHWYSWNQNIFAFELSCYYGCVLYVFITFWQRVLFHRITSFASDCLARLSPTLCCKLSKQNWQFYFLLPKWLGCSTKRDISNLHQYSAKLSWSTLISTLWIDKNSEEWFRGSGKLNRNFSIANVKSYSICFGRCLHSSSFLLTGRSFS